MCNKNIKSPYVTMGLSLLGGAFALYLVNLLLFSHGFWAGVGIIALVAGGLCFLRWAALFSWWAIAACMGLVLAAIAVLKLFSVLLGMLLLGIFLLSPILIVVGGVLLFRGLRHHS